MAVVIAVPDPDIAAIFDYACVRGGFDAERLKGSGGGLDLLTAFDLHGDGNGARGVGERKLKRLADGERLRGSVENGGERVGCAGGDGGLLMLADAGDEILFCVDAFAADVIELEIGVDLAAAFDQLAGKAAGAAGLTIEGRLEAVTDAKDEVDGADRVRSNGDALHVSIRLLVEGNDAGGKDAPVNGVVECLLCGEIEAGLRRAQRWNSARRLRVERSQSQDAG